MSGAPGSVALVLRPDRDGVDSTAAAAIAWLRRHGHEVRLLPEDAERLDLAELARDEAEIAKSADLAVSIGGDGTMLRTVSLAAGHGVPVLGVNHGQLGYLTAVEPGHLEDTFERFFAGRHLVEERMLLSVEARSADGSLITETVALNEAVLEKTYGGRTVRLEVSFDGAPFTPYTADGLIVATPTGSTAYAFSARGPIIDPTHRAILLTPVSPHMLFDRSLVLAPEHHLRIEVAGDRTAALAIDGVIVHTLEPGDSVLCTAAATPARLVVNTPRNFHRILKEKFGLADR
jgi:NAD+ kinase